MGKTCAMFDCFNNSSKEECKHLSFHVFPPINDKRRAVWVNLCRRQDVTMSNLKTHHTICSLHFSTDSYKPQYDLLKVAGYTNIRRTLTDDAIPNLLLPTTSTSAKKRKRDSSAIAKREKCRVLQGALEIPQEHTESAAPSTSSTCTVTSHPSIATQCEPPIKASQATRAVQTRVTRVKHRSRETQVFIKPKMVSTGTQCDIISIQNGQPTWTTIPTTKSAPISPPSQNNTATEQIPPKPVTEQIPPIPVTEQTDDGEQVIIKTPVIMGNDDKYFLVAESELNNALKTCSKCAKNCDCTIKRYVGTMIVVDGVCKSCGHTWTWRSDTTLGSMPRANLKFAASIFFCGSGFSAMKDIAHHMNMPIFSERTFYNVQESYIIPSVMDVWQTEQSFLIEAAGDNPVKLGGDGRADSPGHCAKYVSYTMMNLATNKILDVQIVQSNEVESSVHCEREGLIRSLTFLEDAGLNISHLVTDRHGMIKKFMRLYMSKITHNFDTWHVVKSILKKLMAIAKKRGFEVVQAWERAIAHQLYWIAASSNGDGELMLAKWLSLLNHICNVHSHDSDLFPQCQHGDIDEERDWITKDSRQYRAIEKIVRAKLLCTDIKKLSPDVQTYSLEVFHSVLNGFAPKSTHYFYDSMLARTLIAALHFNENGKKEQALTSTGDPRWAIAYPKQFKGQKAVAKTVKAKSTYEYVDRLMEQLFVLRELYPSYPLAKAHKKERCDQAPPPLTSKYVEAVKSDVVSTRVSRFSHI